MIMACMVVWFTRGTVLFLPAVTLNAFMVPATLSHGGHHLVDLLAGVVVFSGCVWLSGRLIRT
jgi:membrane-associated phospholipid phosphatase